jgi:hypothetical protein
MRLSQFDATVNKNTIQGKVTSPVTLASAGGDTSGSKSIGAAVGNTIDTIGKLWVKDQNDRVIDAINDYQTKVNSMMDDEKNGLYNTMQGKNAEGLQKAYAQGEQQIYDQVLKDHGIDSRYAKSAFDQRRQNSMTNTLDNIDRYQRGQMEVYANEQLDALQNNLTNETLRNPKSLIPNWSLYEQDSRAILKGLGYDNATIDDKLHKVNDENTKTLLNTMATTGDYTAMQNVIAYARTRGVSESILKPAADLAAQKKLTVGVKEGFSAWVKRKGLDLTKMTKEEAWELYSKDNPFNAGSYTTKGFATGNATFDQYDNYFDEAQQVTGLSDAQIRNLKAMCLRESSFDPKASNGDHVGLFEFDAPTAQSVGLDPADRTDPRKSIIAAAKLYKSNLEYHGGDDDLAILSHNGGRDGTDAARNEGYLDAVKKDYDELYPGGGSDIGSKVAEYAQNNYTLNDHWKGTVTDDDSKQCDSWTADVYSKTGILPGNRITTKSDFGDCYHSGEDVENGNYTPAPGDFIDGARHVGIYIGNGQYMARNSSGGIHIGNMEEFSNISGGILGYGSVNELAKEEGISSSRGSYISDEEKAQLNAKREEIFDSEYENEKRQQIQYISNQVSDIQKSVLEMRQGGSTAADIYSYVSDRVNADNLLTDSSQGTALMNTWFNAKESEARRVNAASNMARGLKEDGTLRSKNFNALDALIGEEISTEDELSDKINLLARNGIYVSPDQKAQLEKDLTDAQNGVGPHAVKIPDDDQTIANECWTTTSAVTPTAKMLIRREILNFRNDNGRDLDAEELRTIYYNVIGKQTLDDTGATKVGGFTKFHIFGSTFTPAQMSEADMYSKHISDLSQAVDDDGNPNGYYVERDYGNGKKDTVYVSNDQMQEIADGSLSVFQL